MIKRLLGIIIAVSLIFGCASALSSCTVDLSHKHYYNSIGKCGTCGYSISTLMSYSEDDKEYTAECSVTTQTPSNDGCYYFHFIPHGEELVGFYLLGDTSVEIDRIDVYLNNAANHKGTPLLKDGLLTFDMMGGESVHLKVKFTGAGVVVLHVNEIERIRTA